jgi:hypothetical protein
MHTGKQKSILTNEDFDSITSMSFLEGLTKKIIDATHTVDNHANVMIGINTGIFALVISKLFEIDTLRLTMGVVAIFSALSAIAALFAIRLPRIIAHKEREQSLLHAPRIAEFGSAEAYADELQKMIINDREVFRQHALEAYNLSKFYYLPKRRMLTYSRIIFIFGVMASGLFLLLEKLDWFFV